MLCSCPVLCLLLVFVGDRHTASRWGVDAGTLEVLATGSPSLACSRIACQRSGETATSQPYSSDDDGDGDGCCQTCVDIKTRSMSLLLSLLCLHALAHSEELLATLYPKLGVAWLRGPASLDRTNRGDELASAEAERLHPFIANWTPSMRCMRPSVRLSDCLLAASCWHARELQARIGIKGLT